MPDACFFLLYQSHATSSNPCPKFFYNIPKFLYVELKQFIAMEVLCEADAQCI